MLTCACVHCLTTTRPPQKLGLEEWVAKGDVETLKFIREGGLDDLGEGDVEYLIERKPRRFGDFVKESIKPMVAM